MAPFHSALLHLYLYCLLSAHFTLQQNTTTPPSAALVGSKPGCARRCGAVKIPYPFGIGSNCSITPAFTLSCNTSAPPGRSLLLLTVSQRHTYRVVNISTSQIRIRNPIYATRCTKERLIPANLTMDFSGSPYTLSEANSVTQVGCTDLTVLEGFVHHHPSSGDVTQNNFAFGCVSFCYTNNFSSNGSCPGNGCCQIPVPKGTVFLNTSISGLQNRWENVEDNPCSYSFLGEKDSFTFQAVSELYKPGVPTSAWLRGRTVVLDWRIGRRSCRNARSSGGFACQENTDCIDAVSGVGGYRCKCSSGYEGNPYLPPGCRDVDECKSNPCHVTGTCTNIAGGYICGCPAGYLGTGWRNDSGCFPVIHPKSKLSNVSIGFICGMSFTTLLSISFGFTKFFRKRKDTKRRHKFFKQNGGLLLKQQTSVNEGILGNIRIFNAKELEKATDRFNESRILGRGGQGTVYKGMLSDGQIVAIKKSSQFVDEHKSKHVVEQFINEVALLSQINHRNVVKLLGCCLETKVPLLVYEYVANGTLYHLIHDDKNSEFPFSWNVRLKIATDVVGALAYLHSATSLPIFHRDIKSTNILLDEKYVAKVSDFGTSKSVREDQTHLTTNVNGTFGYIDPEYFQSNQFTEKSDVYSFGVVLVELLTGLKPIISSPEADGELKSLVMRFLSSMSENKLESIVDEQVWAEGEKECVVAVAKLAERCLNLNGKKRPNMKEVGMELEGLRCAQMGLKADTKLSEDSCSDKEGSNNIDDNFSWTTTFDFPTDYSFAEAFPIMFDQELRQKTAYN